MTPRSGPLPLTQRGVFAIHDTGAPSSGGAYRTLVIVNGFGWTLDAFNRLVPLADGANCRLVLVNRRGYPDATPFTSDELAFLATLAADESAEARGKVRDFGKDRGREVYDLVIDLVRSDESITPQGGITVAGWSFGATFSMTFLAYAPTYAAGNFDLRPYIHSVVNLDPPCTCFACPLPAGCWHPVADPDMSWEKASTLLFPRWVSGYYQHGPDTLEYRNALETPSPTLDSTPEWTTSFSQITPKGADSSFILAFLKHPSVVTDMRVALLYPSRFRSQDQSWNDVPLRHVWCEQSVWTTVHGARSLQAEVDAAKNGGISIRPVEITCVKGANHFVVWDYPERALAVLLGKAA